MDVGSRNFGPKVGAVIQLDKLAGEMTDIYLNGLPLARGEVVVIGDSLHIRIGEILGAAEKTEDDLEDA
jgi:flagellar motor switch protein FliN/FliY